MEKCSTELVALIFEYACLDDVLGITARNLGLVCKAFRVIVEPIELRAIKISGLEQLQGACARLKKAGVPDATGSSKVAVRHLFICELDWDHALLVDTDCSEEMSYTMQQFWHTGKGKDAGKLYKARSRDFWKFASELVRAVSSTLETLCLLSADNWMWHPHRDTSKVIGALSGLSLPNLTSLTLSHSAKAEQKFLEISGISFRLPDVPLLQKLYIVSELFADRFEDTPMLAHPFLCLRHECADLREFHFEDQFINCTEIDVLMRTVFGADWETVLARRSLPGKLRSVVFGQEIDYCCCGSLDHQDKQQRFVDDVKRFGITGLEARPYMPAFPGKGERRYERFLYDWDDRCLGYS